MKRRTFVLARVEAEKIRYIKDERYFHLFRRATVEKISPVMKCRNQARILGGNSVQSEINVYLRVRSVVLAVLDPPERESS